MRTIDKVITGLLIVSKYSGEVDAQHDVIYAGEYDKPVSAEDAAALRRLGWEEYDDNAWMFYT